MPQDTNTAQVPATPPLVRRPDFRSNYANNARFESTVYDLKLVFGESDLSGTAEVIQQHTAITIPWALVKVAMYYLQVNLLAHEAQNGEVRVPPNQVPPPFPDLGPQYENDPAVQRAIGAIRKLREKFIAEL